MFWCAIRFVSCLTNTEEICYLDVATLRVNEETVKGDRSMHTRYLVDLSDGLRYTVKCVLAELKGEISLRSS